MNTISKALVGTIAAGAMAVSAASPAFARDGDHDGIDAGDVIAGALVIGGVAAVIAATDNDRDDGYRQDRGRYEQGQYYGERYDHDRYGRDQRPQDGYRYSGGYRPGYRSAYGGWREISPRRAIEQCVYAAEQRAGRYTYGRADVTDIRNVRETRTGVMVYGRIAVQGQQRGWQRGDGDYGRGWNGDYRGWNSGLRGYDSGTFSCRIERARVVDVDYYGIRGLN